MARWKLVRQTFGCEEFIITEGTEVSIGRGINNTITLKSLVISREHCVIKVNGNEVTIKDLKSSNGTYVSLKKITPNIPVIVAESDIIGIGWANGSTEQILDDNAKFEFKLVKESVDTNLSISERITFQNDNIEDYLKHIDEKPIVATKTIEKQKRRLEDDGCDKIITKQNGVVPSFLKKDTNVITLLSESDSDIYENKEAKKLKLSPDSVGLHEKEIKSEFIKIEEDYEEFDIKPYDLNYGEEPICLDSDSDSESERWILRLSQSSPGKPFMRKAIERTTNSQHESSYSQMIDDNVDCLELDENMYDEEDDIISLPIQPFVTDTAFNQGTDEVDSVRLKEINAEYFGNQLQKDTDTVIKTKKLEEIGSQKEINPEPIKDPTPFKALNDFNAECFDIQFDEINKSSKAKEDPKGSCSKSAQMIQPMAKTNRKSLHSENKSRCSTKRISSKTNKHSSNKHTANSRKDERKKKLKEIAEKEKESRVINSSSSSSSKSKVIVKTTSSNRGAFLTERSEAVKPTQRRDLPMKPQEPDQINSRAKEFVFDDNKDKKVRKSHCDKSSISKSSIKDDHKLHRRRSSKSNNITDEADKSKSLIPKVLLKNINLPKPLTDCNNKFSGKPVSKVEPMPPPKVKKQVRFSEAPPQVKEFDIEPGNQMKNVALVKSSLLPKGPRYSLEKKTLMRILRWNPHWLKEQVNNNEPPPILGQKNITMNVLQSYQSLSQYIQLVGDLVLMEIWECVTQAFNRKKGPASVLQMRIETLSPLPSHASEYNVEIFSLSVNVSLPKSDVKKMPKTGELMLISFGEEGARNDRFFYVHNVRTLPSPPNNKYLFFSISLQTRYTDKMMTLRRGEVMEGITLSYLKNELVLFESMEYLSQSPLRDAILRPVPSHFAVENKLPAQNFKSQWTETLNESQLNAVVTSVSAALSNKPSLQMIQGPPGTGKSSVICSIVMSYFYNQSGKLQQNREKILICATSNAAVDELVLRLLHVRQSLPKSERFRMVRVGRPEAMHARAAEVSSQTLAARDTQRAHLAPPHAALEEEIARQEARLNMWKSNAEEARDPGRVAYCNHRVSEIMNRIQQLRGSSGTPGGGVSPEQMMATERRIIEGANIVVTTLASAANQKMRGLRRRIALCIIDEAGQAIEPETLVPLTLDVTRLTLIGDPQQLPGFICSQRAKQYGLGESLFSRLCSYTECWGAARPVHLLNVQYRMHPAIADYPNRAFYGGRVSNAARERAPLPLPPYCMLCIASGDKGQVQGANDMEAWGVARLALAVSALARPARLSVAVLTPYNAHKELVRHKLRLLQETDAKAVEVTTVDSFQGQECDIVVVSLARSQGVGFLTDAGRMNVMLTRAKQSLLICLNPNAMMHNEQWRTLMEDAQQRNLYTRLPNKVCLPTTPEQLEHDDILKYITPK